VDDNDDDRSTETPLDAGSAYLNRELSWLAFARRVLALVEDTELPLLERVKFAGIIGMLHDEFFMKRIGGLKREGKKAAQRSIDGRTPAEELELCREEILQQMKVLARAMGEQILPALEREGIGIRNYADLSESERGQLREQFAGSILPILTPLAVDAQHPFPFISNQGLNLAIQVFAGQRKTPRFVRLKVPTNRPRWIPVPGGRGVVPIEQLIASNLDLVLPDATSTRTYLFRVTRGIEASEPGDASDPDETDPSLDPGRIIRQVTSDLKARKFAGVTRLKVSSNMPEQLRNWLAKQLAVGPIDIYPTETLFGLADLLRLEIPDKEELRLPAHVPVTHPRLGELDPDDPTAIFDEIRRGDILLHHPYQSFDTSVLAFLRSAAADPRVLAIKLTIYRTSSDSPIVRALTEAARAGKQVAVVVEITARFDEAPNIAWGQLLENEGAHVAYGFEKLKTHVKLALVVREEERSTRSYAHIGTGNYHTGTARIYEDLGLLTCDPAICRDVAAVFNQLTGALPSGRYRTLVVAPQAMRARFVELVRREADHARAGRRSGIRAKLNQLQDPELMRELYRASQAGVPMTLHVRGLCCLRPGVPGLSESIRVFSVVGRFLEHGRVYEFTNDGRVEYYLGSADWMKRNLDRRVETIVPVTSPALTRELGEILDVYERDNCSAWDCAPDGRYERRQPKPGEPRRAAQEMFIALALGPDGGQVSLPTASRLER
jgi:polyphosphate kinase